VTDSENKPLHLAHVMIKGSAMVMLPTGSEVSFIWVVAGICLSGQQIF
jgi:hypothetical protein